MTNLKKVPKEFEFLKFIVESIKLLISIIREKNNFFLKETLFIMFRFEGKKPLPREKEEWEKDSEDLFVEIEMCILESHYE